MNSGVIGKSGRKITVKDMDGNSKEIEEPEQMHTFRSEEHTSNSSHAT